MSLQQQYWECLKSKYENKTRDLQQREYELRHRLACMEKLMKQNKSNQQQKQPCGNGGQPQQPPPCECDSNPSTESCPGDDDDVQSSIEDFLKMHPGFSTCICPPPQERAGFFKSLFAIFPSRSKSPPTKQPKCKISSKPPDEFVPAAQYNNMPDDCLCSGYPVFDSQNKRKESDESCTCSSNIELARKNPSVSSADSCTCGDPGAGGNLNMAVYGKSAQAAVVDQSKIPNSCSLKSLDFYYMKNLEELANQEKTLARTVQNLERKNQAYTQVLCEFKNMNPQFEEPPPRPQAAEKSNAELKLENFLLKGELKDMRLEVKQYLEKMEGPIQFKIEHEMFKRAELEKQLEEAKKWVESKEKEMNDLKLQVCKATSDNYDLRSANEKARRDLQEAQDRCAELEDNLIRQKISEAETLKSLRRAMEAKSGGQKEECDLHHVARELSKVLKECEPCGDCMNLPDDLTQAAKLLKSLTDMIDRKLPKRGSSISEAAGTAPKAREIPSFSFNVKQEEIGANSLGFHAELKPMSDTLPSITNAPTADAPTESSSPKTTKGYPDEMNTFSSAMPPKDTSTRSAAIGDSLPFPCPPQMTDAIQSTSEYTSPTTVQPESKCKCSKGVGTSGEVKPPETKRLSLDPILDEDAKKKCKCSRSLKNLTSTPVIEETKPPRCDESILQLPKKKLCKCMSKNKVEVDQIWPKTTTSERLKVDHKVTASRSQDLLKSETSVKALKVKENFPFEVDTQVDVIDKPPEGVHVTTTITKSGTLEVVTEGPEGVIETTLVYTDSGNVEVVTEILEYSAAGKKTNIGRIKSMQGTQGTSQLAIQGPSDPYVCPPFEQRPFPPISDPYACPPDKCGKRKQPEVEDLPPPPPPQASPSKAGCSCNQCPLGGEQSGSKPPSRKGSAQGSKHSVSGSAKLGQGSLTGANKPQTGSKPSITGSVKGGKTSTTGSVKSPKGSATVTKTLSMELKVDNQEAGEINVSSSVGSAGENK